MYRFSRVGFDAGLVATYGVNTFVIKAPAVVADQFPDAVQHCTFYGRLVSTDAIVNVDIDFTFDARLQGYKGRVDIRDPGVYTLQVRHVVDEFATFDAESKQIHVGAV
jgi:hypothetical protein